MRGEEKLIVDSGDMLAGGCWLLRVGHGLFGGRVVIYVHPSGVISFGDSQKALARATTRGRSPTTCRRITHPHCSPRNAPSSGPATAKPHIQHHEDCVSIILREPPPQSTHDKNDCIWRRSHAVLSLLSLTPADPAPSRRRSKSRARPSPPPGGWHKFSARGRPFGSRRTRPAPRPSPSPDP